MKHDPHERIELTGPWAGFGFQGGHMWTPEGHTLFPEDMVWWSLTCNIAREWRSMMEAGLSQPSADATARNRCSTGDSKVVFLQDVLRRRQEQPSSEVAGARFADRATVVRATRGPSRHRRG